MRRQKKNKISKRQKIVSVVKAVEIISVTSLINLLGKEYSPDLRRLISDGIIGVDAKWKLYIIKDETSKT